MCIRDSCKLVSRHICRTAARLNLPLEYNIGYEDYNDEHGITTIPVSYTHLDVYKRQAVGAEYVVESTGLFLSKDKAQALSLIHI